MENRSALVHASFCLRQLSRKWSTRYSETDFVGAPCKWHIYWKWTSCLAASIKRNMTTSEMEIRVCVVNCETPRFFSFQWHLVTMSHVAYMSFMTFVIIFDERICLLWRQLIECMITTMYKLHSRHPLNCEAHTTDASIHRNTGANQRTRAFIHAATPYSLHLPLRYIWHFLYICQIRSNLKLCKR